MNNLLTKLSALQQAGIETADVQSAHLKLQEIRQACVIRVHSLDSGRVSEALQQAEIQLPIMVGEVSGRDPQVMCFRPAEWLIFSETQPVHQLLLQLQELGQSQTAAIDDVSDALTTLRLSGAAAPWLLAKLSGLDFVGGVNAGPHCARAQLGRVAVVVNYRQAGGVASEYVYDLLFDRSVALYLWDLLQHSADHAEELANLNDLTIHTLQT